MAPSWRTSAVVEGAHYLSDLGICSQRSKSGIGSILNRVINDIKDGKVDETYASFLQDLQGFWESQFVEEENEDDPTYMMFLENLKVCGNGYMLGVSIKHGVSFPIKYEVEDNSPAELKRKIPRCRGSLIRERRSLDLDNAMQSGQRDSVCLIRKRRSSAVNDELNSGLRNSGLAKENFLRRSPRIIKNSSNSQRNSEVDLDVSGDLQSDSQSADTQSHTLVRKQRKSLVGDGERNSSLKNASFGKENTTRHSSRVVENSLDAMKKNPACKLRMPHSIADTADETYKFFIAGLKVDGDSVYYECEDGKRVYYEEDDQQKSAYVDDEPQRSAPTPRPPTPPPRQPTPPPRLLTPPPRPQTDKDDSHMLSKPKKNVANNSKAGPRDFSWFWKAVEKDLRRPFEQKEYADLLENVNARKPIGVHKETRSGGYKTEFLSKLGKSYLDSFPDLKHEIEKSKSDPFKVLNLLRGFFFYLKKLPHGVPKPWKNEYCKTIMPGTRCA